MKRYINWKQQSNELEIETDYCIKRIESGCSAYYSKPVPI